MWMSALLHPRRRLTAAAVEVAIHRRGLPAPLPGQFCVIEVTLNGRTERRSFSIVGVDAEGRWLLGIKQARTGGVSEWVNRLTEPAEVAVAGPFGEFGPLEAERHVLVAGGSGITPIWAVTQALVAAGARPELWFGNDRPEDAMYGDEIRQAAASGQITLHEVHDRRFTPDLTPSTALYVCGPSGLLSALQPLLTAHPAHLTALESYGPAPGEGIAAQLTWQPRFGRSASTTGQTGATLLETATEAGWPWDHACGVGACGTCRVALQSGAVDCAGRRHEAGEEVLSCIAHPLTPNVTLKPARGWRRPEAVAAALVLAVLSIGLWAVPPGMGFRAQGPLNTGHQSLACGDCHRDAPGTVRQQLSHNARGLLGLHDAPWVDVLYGPVDNAACLECHDRPNDRHPTSRFEELRFAEQRATLGPHECNNCHGEHHGERVAAVEPGFCVNCHSDLEVEDDPIDVPHADLVSAENWASCLTCHDFHGNHERPAPTRMADRLSEAAVRAYFAGEADPYGDEKRYTATQP